MKRVNGDYKLQNEEPFIIAEFQKISGKTDDNIKKECENLANNWDGGEKTGFKDKPKCDSDGNGGYILTAKKNDDRGGKKKLSAGAIAGIVIACVVVVAAIIALLVYFFVIKKKNQSTTSTQVDSSIAI